MWRTRQGRLAWSDFSPPSAQIRPESSGPHNCGVKNWRRLRESLSLNEAGATPRLVSLRDSLQIPLDILALGLSLPQRRLTASNIFRSEAARVKQQLDALSESFRARLMPNLGIESVMCEDRISSRDHGRKAAERALNAAELSGNQLGLIIDYTTFAADSPSIWSLGHDIQQCLSATDALVLGIRGSGCCGLHIALRTAQAFFASDPGLEFALLVASDRAPDGGRVCLPISVMADAASAIIVARPELRPNRIGRLRAVITQSSGRFVDVISSTSLPPAITVDSAKFEQQLMPLHFVVLSRLLTRALAAAELSQEAITALIYPNTSERDRQSFVRALDFDSSCLLGPGPVNHGHAFANDLVINAQALFASVGTRSCVHSAWLAAGSGFTWGAAIIDTV